MQTSYDAVVIGAGPAGSAAAILLAAAGWSVALVEKQRFPRRKVCGECIAASNLPLLDALGIGAAFDAHAGPPLRQVALMRGDDCIVAPLPAAAHPRHRWGRALGRETLDALLLERARTLGVRVLQPWAVQAIEGAVESNSADVGRRRCTVQHVESRASTTLCAPVVIDAHGSWEALPTGRSSARTLHAPADLLAFKANFRAASLREGLLPVLSFEGGYGGMVVAGNGLTTLACCVRRDRLEALRRAALGQPAGEAVQAALERQCAGVRSALQTATREGPWLAAGPLVPGIRLSRHDGVLRIGNAAGEAHPIIGEGMSMAMQSAFLLCAHLLDGSGTAARRNVARNYAAAWRSEFGPRCLLAAAFAHAAMRPVPGASLAWLARAWPGLLTRGARWGGKVRNTIQARPPCPAQ